MEKVPYSLPLPFATSQTHASKDHRWVGFEKLLFSSGAKSSFAASTTFGVVWGFTFFPIKKTEQLLEASHILLMLSPL